MRYPALRAVVGIRGMFAALFVACLVFTPKVLAQSRVEYKGWDSTGFFHMILDISQNASTKAIVIDGGRIEFKSLATPYPIQQAQGSMVPKPAPNEMAGVVLFSQANIGISATMFTGNLVGSLASGTLYARNVRFQAYNKTFDLNITLTPGGAPVATPPPQPVLAPKPLPVILTKGAPATPPPATTTTAATRLYVDSSNTGGVTQGSSTKQPILMTPVAVHVTQIWTYHWNNGRGAAPGTIALKAFNGVTYGPWQASGSAGSGNAPNVNWTVNVNVTIPAGTYYVVDSAPSTWSENAQSYGIGFAKVYGHP